MKYIIITLLIFTVSCSKPADQANKSAVDKLIVAYTTQIKQTEYRPSRTPVTLDSLDTAALDTLITPAEFRRAINYLHDDPQRWNVFFTEAEKMLKAAPVSQDSTSSPVIIR